MRSPLAVDRMMSWVHRWRRMRIIVFSSPPLSGKSLLSKTLATRLDPPLEMDRIRLKIPQDSDHSKRDRDVAFRTMHKDADQRLASRWCRTVIVDATDAPRSTAEASSC